jgi:antitoxin MazE
MVMRKKLATVGNSLGIIIEKPILSLLNIDRNTELEVRTDGDRLILEPVREAPRKKRIAPEA